MLLLFGLVPVRAIAAVTLDACKSNERGSEQPRHHAASDSVHSDEHGSHDDAPGDASHGCGYCATHCAGMALALAQEPIRFALARAGESTPFGARFAPGFCPDLLDRPPLSS